MTGMPMWTAVCGQQAWQTAAHFLAMWCAMTAVMMAPSLAPVLWRWRRGLAHHRNAHTAAMAAGYFGVWALIGAAVFVLGAAASEAALRWSLLSRAVPLLTTAILLAAGALQFTRWKSRHLACCRHGPPCERAMSIPRAWRSGVQLGLHCAQCSSGLTLALLVLGMMQPRVMLAATVAVSVERLARFPDRASRAVGALLIAAALVQMSS